MTVTNFITPPSPPKGAIKLSGRMSNYRCTRGHASFFFTEGDQNTMGVVAVAAAAAGLAGPAMGVAVNTSSMEEAAHYVEFDLDDQPVKGWVWRSPFKEGDEVEVAAEWQRDHYEVFGIARPADRIIALYPHCSRGRTTHVRNAVKWWAIFGAGFLIFVNGGMLLDFSIEEVFDLGGIVTSMGLAAFFALAIWSMTHKWMPFVRVAERVFTALDWPNPGDVDLVKTTKAQRQLGDSGELGVFYFRY